MKRRGKIIATITTMCLALAMLVVGVYAASTVSFNIGGTVSYKIEDAYVNITTKIYSHSMYSANRNAEKSTMVQDYGAMLASLGMTAYPNVELYNKVEELSSTKLSDIDTNEYKFVKEYSYSSVTDGEPTPITDVVLPFNTTDALTYFIVINVENLSDEPVYAVIQDNLVNAENTVQLNTGVQQNIVKGEENRNIVIGFGIADLTTSIDENSATKAFSYGIKVGLGDITETEENKAKLSINYNSDLHGYLASVQKTAKGAVVVPATYDDGTNGEKNVVATAPIETPTNQEALINLLNLGLTCVALPETVGMIAPASFAVNIALTKITGLENVASVGDYGFMACLSLTDISLPTNYTAGAYSFYNCCSLASFDIPTNMTSVPEFMLSDCTSLTSITISSSVTNIERGSFSFCDALETVVVEEGNLKYTSKINGQETNCIIEIGNDGANTTYTVVQGCKNSRLLEGLTGIAISAFEGCSELIAITIPQTITYLDEYFLSYCSGLETIIVEEGNSIYTSKINGQETNCVIEVETNGTSTTYTVVQGCKNSILLNGITNISYYAFDYCTGLTSITIPSTVTDLEGAFDCCSGLETIIVEEGNSKYTSRINGQETNCLIRTDYVGVMILRASRNSTIPNGITHIDSWAFSDLEDITKIVIPNSVVSVGYGAFAGWTADQSIYFEGTSMPENLASGWNSTCNAKIYLNGELWTGA